MSETTELSNYIRGEWCSASCEHWIEDYSPANGALIARIPCSSSEDVDAAVDAALDASTDWAALSISERAGWLEKIADALEVNNKREEVYQICKHLSSNPSSGVVINEANSIDLVTFSAK